MPPIFYRTQLHLKKILPNQKKSTRQKKHNKKQKAPRLKKAFFSFFTGERALTLV
jgi:hypothetical protein